MTEDEIRQGVEAAFPIDYPVGMEIVSHRCHECDRVERDFRDVVWKEVPASVVEYHFDSLPLFTPRAFRYFLPAYIMASLTDPESNVPEFLFYSLEASGIELVRVREFTETQRSVVVAYLETYCCDHPEKSLHKAVKRWSD